MGTVRHQQKQKIAAAEAAQRVLAGKQVLLDEPIKQLGVYTIDVKLHREVSAPVKVWVVKE